MIEENKKLINNTKICVVCLVRKNIDNFYKREDISSNGNIKIRHRCICKNCMRHRSCANWHRYKQRYLRRRYGISWHEFESLAKKQNFLCAICGLKLKLIKDKDKPGKNKDVAAVDHDHKTKAVRGLLCHRCNEGLGSFNDDEFLLKSAIEYLFKHKGENNE